MDEGVPSSPWSAAESNAQPVETGAQTTTPSELQKGPDVTRKRHAMPQGARGIRRLNGTEPRPMPTITKRRHVTKRGKYRLLTLDALDQRTAAYAAVQKRIDRYVADAGGETNITAAKRETYAEAAVLGAIAEDLAVRWAVCEPSFDLGELLSTVKTQNRLLASADAFERAARDVSSFGQLLAVDADRRQREDNERNKQQREAFEREQKLWAESKRPLEEAS